ncbi:MAG: hypothetical protein Q8L23_11255 [Caulobacter sp.]|nr:hypothetical protein [Caulobacter sp.]
MAGETANKPSIRAMPRTARAVLGIAALSLIAAGGRPEVFVRPRDVTSDQLTAVLGDARIDAAESRGPVAAAIFAVLAWAANEPMLCGAAANAGGRGFVLRVTVLPPSGAGAAPLSYDHPVEVSGVGSDGWRRVSLAHPGSAAPIVTYRCRS